MTYYADDHITLHHGDSLAVLRTLPDASVDCCVTSPPYFGLRDYGEAGQYGLEASPSEYVETMRALFAEVRRVLADDGTLWLNLGDSYSTSQGKQSAWRVGEYLTSGKGKVAPSRNRNGTMRDVPAKNLMGIPWRVAFALQDDGWTLRNDIIWAKPNAMPESVTDRLSTKHEHVFMFSKARSYWFDLDPIRETHITIDRPLHDLPNRGTRGWSKASGNQRDSAAFGVGRNDVGKNPGDVWSINTQPLGEAHFAVMARSLAERCILAGCKPGGTVLDPFSGSGTTGMVALKHGRKYVGIDLSRDYLDLSLRTRFADTPLSFEEPA